MGAPIDSTQAKQHTLEDWLHLHELDRETCHHLLDEIEREFAKIPACGDDPDQQSLSLDPDGVWKEITSSMCKFLPEHRSIIEDTFQGSKTIAIAGRGKSRKALTVDNGPDEYPTIMYNYFGDVADLLVVAHEFGHALQIRASKGQFMTPVMREACAFLSEGFLLSCYLDENSAIGEKLLHHWHKSSQRYFGNLATRLRSSLHNSAKVYEYGWNYPIARLIALRILTNFSQDPVWSVFQGDFSMKRVVSQLAI